MDTSTPIRAIEDDPVFGRYLVHFTTARLRLLVQAGAIYGISVVIVLIATATLTGTLVNIVVPLLYTLIAMPLIWAVAHVWNREVILFERGFTFRQGSVVAAFPYINIVSIVVDTEQVRYFGIVPIQRLRCVMLAEQGDEMTITERYADARKLADTLERAITQARKPIVMQMLARGDAVAFGAAVSLTRAGITDTRTGETLAWAAYQGSSAQAKDLVIQTTGGVWAAFPIATLENVLLFVSLLKEYKPAV